MRRNWFSMYIVVFVIFYITGDHVLADEADYEFDTSSVKSTTKKWQEQEIQIPAYPKDNDSWLPLAINSSAFRYYIDEKSLSVGDRDSVARYALIIESKQGARNVFYEGMRCDTREYKTYAHGTNDGPFYRMKSPVWRHVPPSGNGRYRADLYQSFLCNQNVVLPSVKAILQAIKYPSLPGID